MLSSLLIVEIKPGVNKPILSLAEFPIAIGTICRSHSLLKQHPVFSLSRRRNLVTEQPVRRPEWLLNH